MSELSDERKAQILAEEKARLHRIKTEEDAYRQQVREQLAEDQYRNQVRAELEGGEPDVAADTVPEGVLAPVVAPTAAVVAEPAAAVAAPAAPDPIAAAPAPARAATGRGVWIAVGAAFALIGGGLASYAATQGIFAGGPASVDDDFEPDLSVVASGAGELTPVPTGSWPAAELGYSELILDDTGKVVPATEAEWAAAAAEPHKSSLPSGRAGALRYVPSDALLVAAADLGAFSRTAALRQVRDVLLASVGADTMLPHLKARAGIDIVGHGGTWLVTATPAVLSDPDELVVVAETGDFDWKRLGDLLGLAGVRANKRKSASGPWYELRGGGGMAFWGPYFVAGPTRTLMAVSDAPGAPLRPGSSLGKVLTEVASSPSGFLAMDFPPMLRRELAKEDPEMGTVMRLAVTVDTRTGLDLNAALRFATSADAQLLERKLEAAVTVGDLAALAAGASVQVDGPVVMLTLRLSDREVARFAQQLDRLFR